MHTKEEIDLYVKEIRGLIHEMGLARQINTHKNNIRKKVIEELRKNPIDVKEFNR